MKRLTASEPGFFSLAVALASLLLATAAKADPVTHEITFTPTRLFGTPFGLTSVDEPFQVRFIVDHSVLQADGVVDIHSFSLIDPIVIGDATFSNADLQYSSGRVVNGELVEIFFLFRFVDPIEGQRELVTYFNPPLEWDATDFNPVPPSDHVFGTYTISASAQGQAVDIGLSRIILDQDFLAGRRVVRAFVPTGSQSPHALCTLAESAPRSEPLGLVGVTVMCGPREFNGKLGVGIAIFLPERFETRRGFELHLTLYHAGTRHYADPIPCPAGC